MSAWFALTALSFHMMAPDSGIYHVNTPLFKRAEIRLSKEYHPCDDSWVKKLPPSLSKAQW